MFRRWSPRWCRGTGLNVSAMMIFLYLVLLPGPLDIGIGISGATAAPVHMYDRSMAARDLETSLFTRNSDVMWRVDVDDHIHLVDDLEEGEEGVLLEAYGWEKLKLQDESRLRSSSSQNQPALLHTATSQDLAPRTDGITTLIHIPEILQFIWAKLVHCPNIFIERFLPSLSLGLSLKGFDSPGQRSALDILGTIGIWNQTENEGKLEIEHVLGSRYTKVETMTLDAVWKLFVLFDDILY
ncbi:hypothetical protein C8J55DRAFT_529984 [Lentinula edodes]|uniref:Uncharacterized protein n=1 Tax=Lentinula lateritia TaxID=40482 RepID=A0A9W8ZR02_9AGAR|nr:hypothetical protein C8J55DRAFT_529984 [Lentinula edodes]